MRYEMWMHQTLSENNCSELSDKISRFNIDQVQEMGSIPGGDYIVQLDLQNPVGQSIVIGLHEKMSAPFAKLNGKVNRLVGQEINVHYSPHNGKVKGITKPKNYI